MADDAERLRVANYDQLLKEMECPICLKPLTPPITMCRNGHNTCGACREEIQNCPSCRTAFDGIRNHLAEKVCATLLFSCGNADAGCDELILGDQLLVHERSCSWRVYKCALGTCAWMGRNTEILDHFKDEHATLVLTNNNNTQTWRNPNLDVENVSCMLISALDEIFFYYKKVDTERESLIISVQYIGIKERASDYLYRFELTSDDKVRTITYSDEAHDDLQTFDETIVSNKCLMLGVEFVKPFIDNEKLVYTLNILHKRQCNAAAEMVPALAPAAEVEQAAAPAAVVVSLFRAEGFGEPY